MRADGFEPPFPTSRRHAIRGSRVLVTGGAGFMGSHLVDLLLAEGAAGVVVFDNLSTGRRENLASVAGDRRLHLVCADLRDAGALDVAMRGVSFVFHFAAQTFDRALGSPRECFDVMITGAVNLLEAAVDARAKKLVMASSASVYGHPSYRPIDEDHPLGARSAFGAAAISAEHLARAYDEMYGLESVVLRYFRVYGSRMTVEGWPEAPAEPAPGRWARYADPDGADLVHVHDAARAAVLALEAPVAGRVYNIASGRDGCIERARLQLGWKPGISLAQGIAEAAPAAVRTCAPAGA